MPTNHDLDKRLYPSEALQPGWVKDPHTAAQPEDTESCYICDKKITTKYWMGGYGALYCLGCAATLLACPLCGQERDPSKPNPGTCGDCEQMVTFEPMEARPQLTGIILKEHIIAAAILVKARREQDKDVIMHVAQPGRHHNIIWTMARDGLDTPIGGPDERHVQGFLTSAGRFVDRKEGEVVARESGQLKGKLIGSVLTSEDLW